MMKTLKKMRMKMRMKVKQKGRVKKKVVINEIKKLKLATII